MPRTAKKPDDKKKPLPFEKKSDKKSGSGKKK